MAECVFLEESVFDLGVVDPDAISIFSNCISVVKARLSIHRNVDASNADISA